MKKHFSILLAVIIGVMIIGQCGDPDKSSTTTAAASEPLWRNHHDTVGYVGIETCASCHADIKHTFQHTGMGMSFDEATMEKAFFDWDGSEVIEDPHSGLSYQPYFRDSVLMVREFRIENGDTIHKRIQKIDYIIGSGQHTNSHIWNVNGFLYQAPFTYYTQEGRSDLPPGYEDGNNSRFSRKIGLECMSCHNAMPTNFEMGSENRFNIVPLGIDCERCHGPGELHVAEKMAGIIVDTSKGPDYSIVNPKRLSADLQMELCQRCHLQGNAVLAEGKSFFDFKPGMRLSDVMDVYLPRYDNSEQSFIMASHADRLKLSDCYILGEGSFNCISCHNPHVSIRETNTLQFNTSCNKCHGGEDQTFCTEDVTIRQQNDDNCVQCHMPVSDAKDIPHVTVHDHWIRVPEEKVERSVNDVDRQLRALVAINNPNPTTRSKARAFLQQYEQFGGNVELLDSAWAYIREMPESESYGERVHLFHLRQTPGLLVRFVEQYGIDRLLGSLNEQGYDNRDAWTAYRVGEAFSEMGNSELASTYYAQARQLAPAVLEFQNKYAATALKMGDIRTAEMVFETLKEMNPYYPEAQGNYGYVQLLYGDTAAAIAHFKAALNLDPDYTPARLNLISSYMATQRFADAKLLLEPLIREYPDNPQYRAAWRQLEKID